VGKFYLDQVFHILPLPVSYSVLHRYLKVGIGLVSDWWRDGDRRWRGGDRRTRPRGDLSHKRLNCEGERCSGYE
jgi:hypothetical protein